MIEVVEFSDEYRAELAIFCKECKELGFKNNESLEAMHVDDSNVVFWLVKIPIVAFNTELQPCLNINTTIRLIDILDTFCF